MTGMDLSPELARQMLARMGEAGQPPERGALLVNTGTDGILDLLREEYVLPIRDAGRNSTFKLVQAPFGGGKTQFLHCLREICWAEGFVTGLIGVSPKECPFDDVTRIYQSVARSLQTPPMDPLEESELGVDAVLRTEIQRRRAESTDEEVLDWVKEEVGHGRVDSHAVRRAAEVFLEAVVTGDEEVEEVAGSFLRGDDVSRSELRPLRIREELSEKSAYRFLRSTIQVFRAMGVPGVALLFDEMDRVLSLTVKRKKEIGDNLRQMIDHCGRQELPGLILAYAVPPEFMTLVVPEYPALEQRLRSARRFSATSTLSPVIDLDSLPMSATELLAGIGDRLLLLFAAAGEGPLTEVLQRRNLLALAEEYGEHQLESGSRRRFVKAAVAMLFEQAREEERILSGDDIRSLAGQSGFSALPELDGEETF
jgi:bacteriophage exclusion system BrxC/D-like protein